MSLARKNTALTFEFFFVESKVGKTGLTVTLDVWKKVPGSAASEIVTAASAVEMGDGLYVYELAAGSNDADRAAYTAVAKTATSTVDQQWLAARFDVDQTFLAAVNGGSATFISATDGDELTAYLSRTWEFTSVDAGQAVTAYENLTFIVKKTPRTDADTAAVLHVDITTGLVRIGGAAPVSAANGTITGTASAFTVQIAAAETPATAALIPGAYTWELIGTDTTPTPDESFSLATGIFRIKDSVLVA